MDRSAGEVRGENLLALRPHWAWAAAAAPMPVFFAAAGWANAGASLTTAATRIRTLVGLGAVVVGLWSMGVVAATVVTGQPGLAGDGARLATQPLWFLAAYLPLAAAGGGLARLATRCPVLALAGCLGGLAALDGARFLLDGPEWIGWPGFFAAWGVPWLVGAWWRGRWTGEGDRNRERAAGLVLAGGGLLAGAALVRWAGYSPALIDAVPGARTNTTPPTLYTAVAGMAQAGLLLAGSPALDRLGRRHPALWRRAGEAAVGVYVWHLTALSACVALLAAGLPAPRRLTGAWWLTRPLWWGAVLAVTVGLVALTAGVRTCLARRRERAPGPGRWPLAGVAAGAAGAAVVGLEGPVRPGLAGLCAGLFAVAFWFLTPRGSAAGDPERPRAPRRATRGLSSLVPGPGSGHPRYGDRHGGAHDERT